MKIKNELTELLGIEFPVIMAPMFLVSNPEMIKAAMDQSVMGVFPALNCRTDDELVKWIRALHEHKLKTQGNFGVNLIVQETNPYYRPQLEVCLREKVPFFITSLGKPSEVIERSRPYGAKVFCDITNMAHAKRCYELGCDGFIAVGQGAGGHAGPYPLHLLVQSLKEKFPDKPVIAAGGITNGKSIHSMLSLGAAGVSIGTRFIASNEAKVSQEYKNAVVDSGFEDICMTTKISGTPCTIIRTPYSDSIGYKQNFIERWLSKNKRTRRLFLAFVQSRGFKALEQAVLPASYKSLWCAGQSVELIHEIKGCGEIISGMKKEFFESVAELNREIS